MKTYDLAGMLAATPVNIYYLTNTMPVAVKMGKEYPAFATLPSNQDEAGFLVTTTLQLWNVLNGDAWAPNIIPYTGPQNWQDYVGDSPRPLSQEPTAAKRSPQVSPDAQLSSREQRWFDSGKNYQPAASPEWALARAMKESGITRGRVAVDDMRIANLLNRIGVADDIEFVDGDNLFRRMRYIKSAVEIEYLRIAGRNNHAATLATVKSLELGMTLPDIEQRFGAECAARGNAMRFVLAGTSVGSFRHGPRIPRVSRTRSAYSVSGRFPAPSSLSQIRNVISQRRPRSGQCGGLAGRLFSRRVLRSRDSTAGVLRLVGHLWFRWVLTAFLRIWRYPIVKKETMGAFSSRLFRFPVLAKTPWDMSRPGSRS